MKKALVFAIALVLLAGCGGARTTDKNLAQELKKLPSDIPVYPNGQVSTVERDPFRVETGANTLAQGVLYFDDALSTVATWYSKECDKQGWQMINLQDSLILVEKNGIRLQFIFNTENEKTKVIYFMTPVK